MPYELLDHTADVGLRVIGRDLGELFVDAARGLTSVLVDDPASIAERDRVEVRVEAARRDDLLHDWLAEVLFVFQARGLVGARFDVAIDVGGGGLTGTIVGERFDEARHGANVDVKAVTYHGLRLGEVDGGYLAEVILDV